MTFLLMLTLWQTPVQRGQRLAVPCQLLTDADLGLPDPYRLSRARTLCDETRPTAWIATAAPVCSAEERAAYAVYTKNPCDVKVGEALFLTMPEDK